MRDISSPVLSVPVERRRDLWTYWRKRKWVEGDYDGSLAWTEIAPNPSRLGAIFFGNPVTLTVYDLLIRQKMVPPDVAHGTGNSLPAPVQPTTRGRKHARKTVKKPPHTLARALAGKREVGRANLEDDGTWDAVEWKGLGIGRRMTLYTVSVVNAWLKTLPGVTRVQWQRRKQ